MKEKERWTRKDIGKMRQNGRKRERKRDRETEKDKYIVKNCVKLNLKYVARIS